MFTTRNQDEDFDPDYKEGDHKDRGYGKAKHKREYTRRTTCEKKPSDLFIKHITQDLCLYAFNTRDKATEFRNNINRIKNKKFRMLQLANYCIPIALEAGELSADIEANKSHFECKFIPNVYLSQSEKNAVLTAAEKESKNEKMSSANKVTKQDIERLTKLFDLPVAESKQESSSHTDIKKRLTTIHRQVTVPAASPVPHAAVVPDSPMPQTAPALPIPAVATAPQHLSPPSMPTFLTPPSMTDLNPPKASLTNHLGIFAFIEADDEKLPKLNLSPKLGSLFE